MPGINSTEAPYLACSICSQLGDEEYAFQKGGREEGNSYLPLVASQLTVLKELKPPTSRLLQLWQCSQCGCYYLYRTDYEFLVNGTEDEEFLTRLSEEEARKYIEMPS